jgi:hypothetical protein
MLSKGDPAYKQLPVKFFILKILEVRKLVREFIKYFEKNYQNYL